jgi:hypothetical protein
MKKYKVRIGAEYLCGTILGEDGHSGRHPMVKFLCAHCPEIGRARFSEVRSGVTKSHGCLKKKCFREYCRRRVARLKKHAYETIFEVAELHGIQIAAAQTGMDPYIISFAWQDRCKEIAGWHPGLLDAVYQTCQTSSFYHAMAVFSLSKAEIKRINRISHCATLAADALSEAERLAAEGFDAQSRSVDDKEALLAQSILNDTSSNLEAAISDLMTEGWWRNGTFTKKELQKNLKRRSDYGWMYHHLSAMTLDQVYACYGHHGLRFLHACDYTYRVRDQHVQEFLDQNIAYKATKSPTMTNQVRKTPVRKEYLPIPGITPVEAANRVVGFVSNLRWLRNPDGLCRSYESVSERAPDRLHRDSKRTQRPSSFRMLRRDLEASLHL